MIYPPRPPGSDLSAPGICRRPGSRARQLLLLLVAAVALAIAAPATGNAQSKAKHKRPRAAQKSGKKRPPARRARRSKRHKRARKSNGGTKEFDFTGIDLVGRLRSPQLLYFLDRASEELELASLKRRSFIPEMVRSVDEEAL